MSVKQQIIDRNNDARKLRDGWTVTKLNTLLGEIMTEEKKRTPPQIDDAGVIAVVTRFIAGLDQMIAALSQQMAEKGYVVNGVPDGDPLWTRLEEAKREKRLLEAFVPTPLTEAEMRDAITGYIDAGHANIGAVMNALKADHAGRYDGKAASTVVREILTTRGLMK